MARKPSTTKKAAPSGRRSVSRKSVGAAAKRASAKTAKAPTAAIANDQAPKRRGRPRKSPEIAAAAPKQRGRPRKAVTAEATQAPKRPGRPRKSAEIVAAQAPKGRGRPRKSAEIVAAQPRKGRGRPPKAAAVAAAPVAEKKPRGRPPGSAKSTMGKAMSAPQAAGADSATAPMLEVKRAPKNADIPLPAYASDLAAGMDLRAAVPDKKPLTLAPGARALVPTGLTIALPAGFEAQVRPRSGLAINHGVTCLNTPGTIDADYRGEVQVILINLGQEPFTIARGERIAQLVVSPVSRASWKQARSLGRTKRGAGGFGSSGKS